MIEKRFTINGTWGKSLNRLKGVICDNNKDMYITDVVNLLNNLSEENEHIKKIIQNYNTNEYMHSSDALADIMDILEK